MYKNVIISPSLLSANFNDLKTDIHIVNHSCADWFHLDIMDGVFVPNISFGFPIVEHVKKLACKPLDVHLMTVTPERYVAEWKAAGADMLTVHYEASTHLHRTVQTIKSLGMRVGVAINPHTAVSLLKDILPDIDMALIMSVNPGFGGQSFIENSLNKIAELRELSLQRNPRLIIQVDGGIDTSNCSRVVAAGANVIVAGSAVFKNNNPAAAISALKRSVA